MQEKDRLHLGAAVYLGYSGNLEDFIRWAAELGFEYVEIKVEPPHLPLSCSKSELSRIKSLLKRLRIEPIVHAPFYDVNIASLNPLVHKASLKSMIKTIRIAECLDARIMVIHAGFISKDFPPSYIAEAEKRAMDAVNAILPLAEQVGVKIGVENKQRGKDVELLLYPQQHRRWVRALKGVGAVVDIGHAHTLGIDPLSYIEQTKDIMLEVHIHDNMGERDEHLALGEGSMPYKECLLALNKCVPLILEMTSTDAFKKSLSMIKEVFC